MVPRSELDSIVKKPIVALHGTRGKSTVHAAGEEQSSVKFRLYYCLMTRFILLILRAPFAAQRVSSGGGVYETRYGKWEEAWRDSHELVEAAAALHEHFEEFARAEGWISLATFSVTVSSIHGRYDSFLRHILTASYLVLYTHSSYAPSLPSATLGLPRPSRPRFTSCVFLSCSTMPIPRTSSLNKDTSS